ncbi:MAG: hypothetical protein HW421_861 [Ignavibacteria bacterium]|nr:hypothetical protein [Ignavibacteria bacterium]
MLTLNSLMSSGSHPMTTGHRMTFINSLLIVVFIISSISIINIKAQSVSSISKETINKAIEQLSQKHGVEARERIENGVRQAADFWLKSDGSDDEFVRFCNENFLATSILINKDFATLSEVFEVLNGHFNKMSLDLKRAMHLVGDEITSLDMIFAGYEPSAHISDDFFANKLAFRILLNFRFYSLAEKEKLGATWNRYQWGLARTGDIITQRIPADLTLKVSEVITNADAYISDYNIFMGSLVDDAGKTLFPIELKLITHWGLRDELKSHYANKDEIIKQRIIYEVMKRIITQTIPQKVINSGQYQWNPVTNVIKENGATAESPAEPDTRYQHLLNSFHAMKAIDPYTPFYNDFIKRKFEQEYEIPQAKVEEMFTKLCSSPQVKLIAELISKRLGRPLEPFDIWYDGFKARSSINENDLTKATREKYPNAAALKKDLENILNKLGFSPDKAAFISSRIEVDAARGSGHAWGADMKSENAHLRTRIAGTGMDYKGYNIAIHEFGHNVEQTMTLQYVDQYMMRGVPNTAFTEAWAFVFQKRDLELLGINENNPDKKYLLALDNFWSCYEIMGVSLVDMNVWKWLYAHPNATAAELKEAVISISKTVWNKYYAPVFGSIDQPILAIYSHMIENPLYLSAYPIGHLIEFQIEKYIDGKNLGTEMERMCVQGKLIPELWMKGAVGSTLSVDATLEAADEAVKKMK